MIRVLAVILAAVFVGCIDGPATFHQPGVQCEPMPWDGDVYGGTNSERAKRLHAHYQALDYEIAYADVHEYEVAVIAVCGAWDARMYEIRFEGEGDPAEDGWIEGPAPTADRK